MRLPKLIGFALMVVVAACEPTVNGFGIIITPSGGANSGLLGFLEQPNATTAGSPRCFSIATGGWSAACSGSDRRAATIRR